MVARFASLCVLSHLTSRVQHFGHLIIPRQAVSRANPTAFPVISITPLTGSRSLCTTCTPVPRSLRLQIPCPSWDSQAARRYSVGRAIRKELGTSPSPSASYRGRTSVRSAGYTSGKHIQSCTTRQKASVRLSFEPPRSVGHPPPVRILLRISSSSQDARSTMPSHARFRLLHRSRPLPAAPTISPMHAFPTQVHLRSAACDHHEKIPPLPRPHGRQQRPQPRRDTWPQEARSPVRRGNRVCAAGRNTGHGADPATDSDAG